MRRISRADLLGTFPVFLLEIVWNSKTYRFSTKPVSLDKEDGTSVQYIGGLEDPDLTEALTSLDKDPEKNTLPVEICFDIDLVEQFFKYGRSLDNAKASLDMVTERDGQILQTYEDRTRLFSGTILQPIIGDPEQPTGHATFTVERNPNNEPSPIIPPSGIFQGTSSIESPLEVAENSTGKAYPIVFGQPQSVLGIVGGTNVLANKRVYGSKGFMIRREASGTGTSYGTHNLFDKFWVCIAGHKVHASTVTVKDYKNNVAVVNEFTGDLSNEIPVKEHTTLQGQTISYVELQYALFNPFGLTIKNGVVHPFQITDNIGGQFGQSGESSEPEYYISWTGGGGLLNENGEGFLNGAGDVINFFLGLSGVDIDKNAWDNGAAYLNSYKISGYIDDPETIPFKYMQDNIFPFVPVQAVNGSNGMRPVIPLLYIQSIPQSIYSVDIGNGFYFISAVDWASEPDDIINRLLLRYGFCSNRQNNVGRLTIDGNLNDNTAQFDKLSNQISQLSFSKYGDRYQEMDFDLCYDQTTANKSIQYIIDYNALPKINMEIEADTQYGWLQLGDVLSLNSTGYFMDEMKVQIIEKKWSGGSWIFLVELEENVSKNAR